MDVAGPQPEVSLPALAPVTFQVTAASLRLLMKLAGGGDLTVRVIGDVNELTVRLGEREATFEIEFLDPGVEAFAFTFG